MIQAVRDVTVRVEQGDFVALLGRSGSGKTTLLNLLGGLDTPSSGQVLFQGRDMGAIGAAEMANLRRKTFGFVFQSFGLLPLLSAQENVELPLRIGGLGRQEREARAKEALGEVGLGYRLKHRPYELSGGEQQRVAIARAMVHRPSVILADEPTAELDSANAKTVFGLLGEIVRRDRVTVIVATHDRAVMEVAHRVLELHDGTLERQPEAQEKWARPKGR
jgi:ABC-type lipoprotein export system ATPase subunit